MSEKIYDDAELAALQVVRLAVTEFYGDGKVSEGIEGVLMPYIAEHRDDEHGDGGAVMILAAVLGRLAVTAWSVALRRRLGRLPAAGEFAAELDRFEMSKLEQQDEEEDQGLGRGSPGTCPGTAAATGICIPAGPSGGSGDISRSRWQAGGGAARPSPSPGPADRAGRGRGILCVARPGGITAGTELADAAAT